MRRAASFFALNSSMLAMIVLVVLIGLGEKMAERFLPLYILALGGTYLAAGLLNSMDNLLSALYSFPGGYLSDKIGYKKALIVFTLTAMFGYLLVIFIPTWQAVLIGAIFFIAWTAVSLPAVMSMVSKSVPREKRTMGVTVHSFVRRVPMALGPVIGGLIIGMSDRVLGIKIAFGVAFLLGLVAITFVWFFMREDVAPKKTEPLRLREMLVRMTRNGPLVNLLVSDILIRFAEQIPYAFVVVWVVEMNSHLSELQFGILTTVEMVTAMLIYIPIAYLADRYTKKPFVLITFGFFTLFPLVLYFSRTFVALVLAFVLRGLKEFGEPTRKALIMDLAPEDAKAATFGTYYLVRDVIVAVVSFGGALLWTWAPAANFLVAFGCGVLGTVLFALFGRDLGRTGRIASGRQGL
jgi:MFS family permease